MADAVVGAGGIARRLKWEESMGILPSTRVAKITVYFEASEVAMCNQKRLIKRLTNEPLPQASSNQVRCEAAGHQLLHAGIMERQFMGQLLVMKHFVFTLLYQWISAHVTRVYTHTDQCRHKPHPLHTWIMSWHWKDSYIRTHTQILSTWVGSKNT